MNILFTVLFLYFAISVYPDWHYTFGSDAFIPWCLITGYGIFLALTI